MSNRNGDENGVNHALKRAPKNMGYNKFQSTAQPDVVINVYANDINCQDVSRFNHGANLKRIAQANQNARSSQFKTETSQ